MQLLYRASCFKVSKRDGDSSLMELKDEFRTYDALRKEHDAQIIQIAQEAGLRIAPEQWSALLYGDHLHKSLMQSIIDKVSRGIYFYAQLTVPSLLTTLEGFAMGTRHRFVKDVHTRNQKCTFLTTKILSSISGFGRVWSLLSSDQVGFG